MHGPMTAVGGGLLTCRSGHHGGCQQHRSPLRRHTADDRGRVDDMFTLDIADNGCGIPADNARRSGLANMWLIAQNRSAAAAKSPTRPEGGTRVRWAVPLTDTDDPDEIHRHHRYAGGLARITKLCTREISRVAETQEDTAIRSRPSWPRIARCQGSSPTLGWPCHRRELRAGYSSGDRACLGVVPRRSTCRD